MKQEKQKMEKTELSAKQKATHIVLNLMVFYDNYTKEEVFKTSHDYMKKKNLDGELSDEEIWDIINKVIDNYVQKGICEIDERGVCRRLTKKVD